MTDVPLRFGSKVSGITACNAKIIRDKRLRHHGERRAGDEHEQRTAPRQRSDVLSANERSILTRADHCGVRGHERLNAMRAIAHRNRHIAVEPQTVFDDLAFHWLMRFLSAPETKTRDGIPVRQLAR